MCDFLETIFAQICHRPLVPLKLYFQCRGKELVLDWNLSGVMVAKRHDGKLGNRSKRPNFKLLMVASLQWLLCLCLYYILGNYYYSTSYEGGWWLIADFSGEARLETEWLSNLFQESEILGGCYFPSAWDTLGSSLSLLVTLWFYTPR